MRIDAASIERLEIPEAALECAASWDIEVVALDDLPFLGLILPTGLAVSRPTHTPIHLGVSRSSSPWLFKLTTYLKLWWLLGSLHR